MRRMTNTDKNSYSLKNCFGFNENEVDLHLWNNSSTINDSMAPLEFQQNKPYRLALYVRATERRPQKTNATLLARNIKENQAKKKQNGNNTSCQIAEKSQEVKGKKREKRIKNVRLFDENVEPQNVSKRQKTISEQSTLKKDTSIAEVTSSRKNILCEVNIKPLAKTKQSKVRRSYERKCKEVETENIQEPPSDEIMKELEIKKLTRSKPKKVVKDDQEFEKWAKSMNSDFNDVDKFELSITYD